jgi:hypothetical protein
VPPIFVDLQNANLKEGEEVPIVKLADDNNTSHPFFQYCNQNYVRTTRLLYVGEVINETGYKESVKSIENTGHIYYKQ